MTISKNKTVIAVCGLGYVGFPVALLLAKAGFKVYGVDINEERVRKINRGLNPIEGKEPGLKELASKVFQKKNFLATTDPSVYQEADVIIVAVETPVEEETHEPAYKALKGALGDIGRFMKQGSLVIIESTIAPGTMDNVIMPLLEEGSGFLTSEDYLLANCPERLMPGHLLENIENYNRVIGGMSQKATATAKQLYRHIVKGELEETDSVTAEIVKAGENAYRDVQIAFANEMALLCEAMGADVWRVRELINNCKKYKDTRPEALRQMHQPGAGVGGHCIPKDSWLLIYGAKDLMKPKLIPLSREINNFMPLHMYDLLASALDEAELSPLKAKIAVLGWAYAGNSDDSRNTPTADFTLILDEHSIQYKVHDPFIKEYKISLEKVLKDADALVLFADHDHYRKLNYSSLKRLMRGAHPIIIDGRNVFDKAKAKEAGFIYKGVGNI